MLMSVEPFYGGRHWDQPKIVHYREGVLWSGAYYTLLTCIGVAEYESFRVLLMAVMNGLISIAPSAQLRPILHRKSKTD